MLNVSDVPLCVVLARTWDAGCGPDGNHWEAETA